ncbi:MAG: 2-hydroxyacyl-CoA dehydratase family protein, partial [Armatimonadota bacterium]
MANTRYFRDILTSEKRARELARHDGPIVGTLCNFVPEELILAAGAVPLRLCGGDYEAGKAVEDIFPRDVCGVARSSLGLLRDGNGIFERVDLLVVATPCDEKKKLSEALGRFAPVHTMLLPPARNAPGARALWLGEIEGFRDRMRELSGKPVDLSALRGAIDLLNARQEAFRRFFELRQHNPPLVTGEDALYVGGASFIDDPARWTEELEKLCDELKSRRRGAKRRGGNGLRLLLTGAPLIFPNF